MESNQIQNAHHDLNEEMDTDAENFESRNGTEGTGPSGDIESSNTISFNPPVYIQRYCTVRETLEDLLQMPKYKEMNVATGKTIMEVGCAEFGLLKYLKNFLEVGKLVFLDKDKSLLEEKSHLLRPLPAEYLLRTSRPEPLVVEAYAGCVTEVDSKWKNDNPDVWGVIGIEIIEHLHPDILRGFEETVFGIISPYVVIVSTPNSDFNQVFNLSPGKFRHWDHKFEWSRSEFRTWCQKIVSEFSNYSYSIMGVGEGPECTNHLGCVSQMAVFQKLANLDTGHQFHSRIKNNAYTLIQAVEYPNYKETRTVEEIISNEVNYYIYSFLFSKDLINQYEEAGMTELTVPFEQIQRLPLMPEKALDSTFLRQVLENGGYPVVTDKDSFNLVLNIQSCISANDNTDDDDDYNMYADGELCEDLTGLTMNTVKLEEETWD